MFCWNQTHLNFLYVSVLLYPLYPNFSSHFVAPSIYHRFSFSDAPYHLIYDFYCTINNCKNCFSPCPRTAGLTPYTPPVQRTGSTPILSWPAEIRAPHSSLGPPSSWRAPSLPCSVPVVMEVDANKRLNPRWQESTGTAAGSSLLALAICEVPVPKLKSSDEDWATVKTTGDDVSEEWVRRGAVLGGRTQKQISHGVSGSLSENHGGNHLEQKTTKTQLLLVA